MVVFKDDPEKYNTPEMFLKIQQDISKVMDLHKQIAINEESIMLNPLVRRTVFFSLFIFFHRNVFVIFFLVLFLLKVREKGYWKPGR